MTMSVLGELEVRMGKKKGQDGQWSLRPARVGIRGGGAVRAVEGLENEPIAVAHDAAIEKLFAKTVSSLMRQPPRVRRWQRRFLQMMRTLVSPKQSP